MNGGERTVKVGNQKSQEKPAEGTVKRSFDRIDCSDVRLDGEDIVQAVAPGFSAQKVQIGRGFIERRYMSGRSDASREVESTEARSAPRSARC